MKVLITTDCYEPVVNGVVVSVKNLENGLSARGHEVRVLTLSDCSRSYVRDNVTYIGSISAERVYPQARIRVRNAHSEYIRDLIDWRPDVVHSQSEFSIFSLGHTIAQACGVPLIHTYHTVYENYTHYFSPNVNAGKRFAAWFSRHVLMKVDRVIAPSEKVRQMLRSYHVEQKIDVIPTGISLDEFAEKPGEAWIREKKQAYGIPQENLVLIFIGRLAKEKNIDELLTFMPELSQKNISLLLVGDGPYREKLEQMAACSEGTAQIVFAGMIHTDEVKAYYHLGDVFVNASTSETQGLTYFEALSSGLPLLCHADSCLDNVIQDGVNGWQYHDREDFLNYICQLQASDALRTEMSLHSLETAKEFSTAAFAEKVEALYLQSIREKTGAVQKKSE